MKALQKKTPQSLISVWDAGKWLGEDDNDKKWATVGAAVAVKPLEQAVFLGAYGDLRGLRCIANSLYAVGMGRQVYQRDKTGSWRCLDAEILNQGQYVVGFEAIDGVHANALYAVGWNGEIWSFNGTRWQQQTSPTTCVLVDVCCAADRDVYACGRSGLLIHGQGEIWEIITLENMS